ncbi:MAG: FtsX-like permease family protein [Longimicrobiales bacterium]
MVQGVSTATIGVAAGLCAAWVLSGFAAPLLYDVDARDTFTFVAVPVVLLAVSALATWLPARRASRMDPARALRESL